MMKMVKYVSVCFALFFVGNIFAERVFPTECPTVQQLRNRSYVLRFDKECQCFGVKEGYDMDNFGTQFNWNIRIDTPPDAKDEEDAKKVLNKLLQQAKDPIYLRDSLGAQCWYLTNTSYVFWLLY